MSFSGRKSAWAKRIRSLAKALDLEKRGQVIWRKSPNPGSLPGLKGEIWSTQLPNRKCEGVIGA